MNLGADAITAPGTPVNVDDLVNKYHRAPLRRGRASRAFGNGASPPIIALCREFREGSLFDRALVQLFDARHVAVVLRGLLNVVFLLFGERRNWRYGPISANGNCCCEKGRNGLALCL
jgi:hypothetical protein